MKAFNKIAQCKCSLDFESIIGNFKLKVSEIKMCVQFKSRPEDDLFLMPKKNFFSQWSKTKDHNSLTEVKFLTPLRNSNEDMIVELIKEIHCGNIKENDSESKGNFNSCRIIEDVDSCVEFGTAMV